LLEIIPERSLEGFRVHTEDKIRREAKCKKIFTAMQEAGPAKFLEKLDSTFLNSLFDDLGLDKPAGSKKMADALLQYADSIGVEHALSSLSVAQLRTIADSLKLSVDSNSVQVFMDCIISGESHKKDKKKAVQPSAKKPDIKKGVTKADLQQHYYRGELAEFCKTSGLGSSGNKKELINRIVAHLEGKDTKKETKKRKAPATDGGAKKKQKTAKGAKATEKSD